MMLRRYAFTMLDAGFTMLDAGLRREQVVPDYELLTVRQPVSDITYSYVHTCVLGRSSNTISPYLSEGFFKRRMSIG